MEFSEIIQNLLASRKITAYRLSKETGISQRLIGYWKKGEKKPSYENLKKLSDFFNVSTDYLITGEDSPEPNLPSDPEEVQLREKLSHYGFALKSLTRDIHDLTVPEMQDVSAVIDFLKAKRLLKDNEHTTGDDEDGKS